MLPSNSLSIIRDSVIENNDIDSLEIIISKGPELFFDNEKPLASLDNASEGMKKRIHDSILATKQKYQQLQNKYDQYLQLKKEYKAVRKQSIKEKKSKNTEPKQCKTLLPFLKKLKNETFESLLNIEKKPLLETFSELDDYIEKSIKKYKYYLEKNSKCCVCFENYDQKPHVAIYSNNHSIYSNNALKIVR